MAIIYMGSMDDRVWRYPWPKTDSTLKSYLNSILQNTLIGHKSAINDGYILNNHILRDSIFKNNSSLLRDIFSTGEIVIPGRKGNFSDLIEEQVQKDIDTFKEVPKSVIDKLESLDVELNESGARISGPESMTVWNGFFELMRSLVDRPYSDLGLSDSLVGEYDFKLALETYLNLPHDGKPPSRTEWEKVLTDLCDKRSLSFNNFSKKALMNLANEAYHYNFSKKLAEHSNLRIDVETSHTPAFSYLLDEERSDIGSLIEDLPLIQIPKFNNLLHIESIEKILDNTGVGAARIEFIAALNSFEITPNDETLKELRYRAEGYNKWIKDVFGKPETEANIADSVNFTLSMLTLPFSAIGAFLSWAFAASGTRVITKKFITNNPIEVDYKKYTMASSKIRNK